MKRLAALALLAVSSLLSGCATYDDYAYYDRDRYYEGEYYDSRHDDRYYYDRYGNRVYYSDYDVSYRYGGVGYGRASWGYPDYFVYNTYYSALWPTYRYYYDPFWSPGFYYGVTFFPRTYFGLNVGWYSWPYYQAYAPYRHSHVDHYYDWWDYSRDRAADRQRHYGNHYLPRYGSARNEAQYLANRTGARGAAANSYYGASTQPGGIVDPMQARSARMRGQTLPFERGGRDWNIEPYGRDGRGYRGFAEGAQPAGGGSREQINRGSLNSGRSAVPYQGQGQVTRPTRGYERDVEQRDSGYVAPMPNSRSSRNLPYRDSRGGATSEEGLSQPRYDRGRSSGNRSNPDASSPQFLPRQTRDPHDPIFERHYNETPRGRVQSYGSDADQTYRGRGNTARPTYPQGTPSERGYAQPVERSEPRYQRSAPSYPRSEPSYERNDRGYAQPIERSEPRYQRSAPTFERSAPTFERSEPRAAPSYERAQPRFEPRSAPSYTPSPRSDDGGGFGRSSSSSDDGGGRSSRGQLERIVRDDD